MSSSHEHRIMLLEQQLKVMQGEMNGVLNEMTLSIQALVKGNKAALISLQAQIEDIRNHIDFVEDADEYEIREGKEI